MSYPSPPLAIEKCVSMLDGKNLVEYIPKSRVIALIKSKKLSLNWDTKNHSQWWASQLYANETVQMKEYLKLYKNGGFYVKYIKPKHKWGRVSPAKALGLTSFCRKTRNTLIEGLYLDFDLKNAQPEIIRNICKSQNPPILCPIIDKYCMHRKEIFEKLGKLYNIPAEKIKKLFLRLCFFGTFEGWCKEMGFENLIPDGFITSFSRELKDIAEITKNVNPTLYETARKSKEAKGDKNFIGSFYALYLQEYELRIVESIINMLMEDTTIMNHPTENDTYIGAYEFDGIKLLKENVEKLKGGKDALLHMINEKTKELTGFTLIWEEKEIEEFHDISEFIEEAEMVGSSDKEMTEEFNAINARLDDTGVIESIGELLPKHFVYLQQKWYGWNGERWENNDRPLRKAIMYGLADHWRDIIQKYKAIYPIDNQFDEQNENHIKLSKQEKKIEYFITTKLRDHTQQTKCVGQGTVLFAVDDLAFDNNPDLIGFKNGVWDNIEECFRPYRFDDFVSWSCGWDFTPCMKGMKFKIQDDDDLVDKEVEEHIDEDRIEAVKAVFEKVFPIEDVRYLVMHILASGLVGKPIEKFFVFNGSGRNGKGVINEMMEWCLGDYFTYVSPLILTENQKNKSSSGTNPELAKIHKKRYVVLKEPSKDQPLHNNVIKDITGGGEISARDLYAKGAESKVKLSLTLVMECNRKTPFAETPDEQADGERIVDILFGSFFTAKSELWNEEKYVYPLDTKLKAPEWKDFHKNAFVNILLMFLVNLKNDAEYIIDKYVPDSVTLRSQEYCQESIDTHTIFTSLFEKWNEKSSGKYKNAKASLKDEDWTLQAIANQIRGSREFIELPQRKKKDMKAEHIKNFFHTNRFYKKSVHHDRHNKQVLLKGWRLKLEDVEEDVEDVEGEEEDAEYEDEYED